jgi:hypothetical protein
MCMVRGYECVNLCCFVIGYFFLSRFIDLTNQQTLITHQETIPAEVLQVCLYEVARPNYNTNTRGSK